MKTTFRILFLPLASMLAAALPSSAGPAGQAVEIQSGSRTLDAKAGLVVRMRPADAFKAAIRELEKLGYQIDHQDSGVLLRASQKTDPAAELRRAGFVNAKGPLLSDAAELMFKDQGDGSTNVSLSVMRTATQGGSIGQIHVVVSRADKEEARIRAALAGSSPRVDDRNTLPTAPPSGSPKAGAPQNSALELKLKKVNATTKPQPIAGELRVGPSGRLEPVARNHPPRAGQSFWLIEVEFTNTTATDLELKGTRIELRKTGGEAVAFSMSLGPAFASFSGASWTLPAKKRKTEKFLAEVDEGTGSLVFTYLDAAPLTIALRRS